MSQKTATKIESHFDIVRRIIDDQLGVSSNSVKLTDRVIEDLGADSLDTVEMVMAFEEELDIEIQDEDAEKIQTVQNIVDYLDDRLGPKVGSGKIDWNDNYLMLTEDQFDERYKPEHDDEGALYRQRDWTNEKDWRAVQAADKELRAWTAVDDDNGDFLICSGIHYVNRLFYIITSKPREKEELTVQAQEPDVRKAVIMDVTWEKDDEKRPTKFALVMLDLEKVKGILKVDEETSSAIADALVEWGTENEEPGIAGGTIKTFQFTMCDDYDKGLPAGVELVRAS